MDKSKISIIIPVYKTEKYLRKCLDSAVNQTLKDIEIIIINDCTPDNCEKIIMEYKGRDDRIVYIKHHKNLGVGGVRNTGINAASGEYQWHIDSDDFIAIDACEILYGTAKKYGVEVLTFSGCNIKQIDENYCYYDNYFSRDKAICNKIFSGVTFLKEARGKGIFHCALWLNLFKSSFIKESTNIYQFRENAAHQDTDYMPILYTNTDTVFCMHYTPYYRLMRDTSVTGSSLTKKKMEDKFAVTLSLLNYILENEINYDHPLTEFALKDYRYYLKIYNNYHASGGKNYDETIAQINQMMKSIKGYKHGAKNVKEKKKSNLIRKILKKIKPYLGHISKYGKYKNKNKMEKCLERDVSDNVSQLKKYQEWPLKEFRDSMQLQSINEMSKKYDIKLNASIDDYYINEMKFVDIVYEVEKNNKSKILDKVMEFAYSRNERGSPGDTVAIYKSSYKKMLKRYFFAGKIFSENKKVLDSCSGVGWGSYILSHYANEVVAYDLDDKTVRMCNEYWTRNNIKWITGNALDQKLLTGEIFDVIIAMETIEHFTKKDGQQYIYNKQRLLAKDGLFIGSSLFPNTRKEADNSPFLLSDEYHLFLWTKQELMEELLKYFSKIKFINNWMFIAQK